MELIALILLQIPEELNHETDKITMKTIMRLRGLSIISWLRKKIDA